MSTKLDPLVWFKAVDFVSSDKTPLKNIEILGVVYVFKKVIDKVSIIQKTLPSKSKWEEGYKSMSIRLSILKQITPPEEETSVAVKLMTNVHRTSAFLKSVLEDTMHELLSQKTWHHLDFIIGCENLKLYDEFYLKEENKDVKKRIVRLKENISDVQQNFKETNVYLSEVSDHCLQKILEQTLGQANYYVTFTEISEHVKIERNKNKIKEKEKLLVKTFQNNTSSTENDATINKEIINHLMLNISQLQNNLEEWRNRYGEEVESLDIALIQMKNKVELQREQYEKLFSDYNKRQQIVNEMQAEADEREREVETRHVINKAVLKVQIWWRNILFKRYVESQLVALKTIRKPKHSKYSLSEKKKKKKK